MKIIKKTCIVNIIANDYLPNQSIFVDQLLQTNRNIDLFCVSLENKDFRNSKFQTIKLKDIKTINNFHEFTFKYNVLELSTAVKPYAIKWLMTEYGYDKVIYFDSDILVYKSLSIIINLLENNEVILTPHIRQPILDDKLPSDIDFSKSGYYNLGFIAFKKTQNTLSFLEWWSNKLAKYCYIDFNKHYFVDQRWIDFAPLFLSAHIIRDPGYNVAYFNLQEYISKFDPAKIIFMHFSGFNLDLISAHQTRFTPETVKEYYPLFQEYQNRLTKARAELHTSEYRYAKYRNGIKICPATRKFLLDENIRVDLTNKNISLANPYITSENNSLFSYLLTLHSSTPVLNALYCLYHNTSAIQILFPHVTFHHWNQSLHDLIQWFINTGAKDYGFAPHFRRQQTIAINEIKPFLDSISPSSISVIPRQFRRLIQFVKILNIPRRNKFLLNIYLFFLLRTPNQEMFVNNSSPPVSINSYKYQVIINILSSPEYRSHSPSIITTHIFRYITKLLVVTKHK